MHGLVFARLRAAGKLWEEGSEMAVAAALAAFVTLVVVLSVLNARRTRGRSCCAPASPADDLRMRAASTEADATEPGVTEGNPGAAHGGPEATPR